jgi:hypothetical protein
LHYPCSSPLMPYPVCNPICEEPQPCDAHEGGVGNINKRMVRNSFRFPVTTVRAIVFYLPLLTVSLLLVAFFTQWHQKLVESFLMAGEVSSSSTTNMVSILTPNPGQSHWSPVEDIALADICATPVGLLPCMPLKSCSSN